MEGQGTWSHRYDGVSNANESIPESDVFYSLNVLLGLAQLPDQGAATRWDPKQLLGQFAEQMLGLPVRPYAFGMAMWASHNLGEELPGSTLDACRRLLKDEAAWRGFKAQDLGLLLSGASMLSTHQDQPWREATQRLFNYIRSELDGGVSGLFHDSATGVRRTLVTYATNVYSTLACFHFGEAFENQDAIERALRCVNALARAQGPHGEWPWFYQSTTGKVLDPYQVYSVHQNGMAPAYLHHAVAHGDESAREQIRRGFEWVFGKNELGCSMLDHDLGLIWRSHIRREPLERHRRAVRGVLRTVTGQEGSYIGKAALKINRECRSYHLGWVLHSFAGREGFEDISHRQEFEGGTP